MKFVTTLFILSACLPFPAVSFAQVRISQPDAVTRNINRLQLSNTPVVDAIALVADLARVSIYLDKESVSAALVDLQLPVTATLRNASVDEILRSVLPSELAFVTQENSIVIASKERIETGQSFELRRKATRNRAINVSELVIDQAFARRIPVHFDQMPLEAVLQMLCGVTGKHVQFDRSVKQYRLARVTVHRDQASVRENLDEILSEAGLSWELSGHQILIRKK